MRLAQYLALKEQHKLEVHKDPKNNIILQLKSPINCKGVTLALDSKIVARWRMTSIKQIEFPINGFIYGELILDLDGMYRGVCDHKENSFWIIRDP